MRVYRLFYKKSSQTNISDRKVKAKMISEYQIAERKMKIRKLKQILQLDGLINQKIEQLHEAKSQATSITIDYTADRVQTSGNGDKVGDAAVRIVELEQYINEKTDEYIDLKRATMAQIDKLDDYIERAILNGRYIDGKTWAGISELFPKRISRQWLSKRHNDAVDHLIL